MVKKFRRGKKHLKKIKKNKIIHKTKTITKKPKKTKNKNNKKTKTKIVQNNFDELDNLYLERKILEENINQNYNKLKNNIKEIEKGFKEIDKLFN